MRHRRTCQQHSGRGHSSGRTNFQESASGKPIFLLVHWLPCPVKHCFLHRCSSGSIRLYRCEHTSRATVGPKSRFGRSEAKFLKLQRLPPWKSLYGVIGVGIWTEVPNCRHDSRHAPIFLWLHIQHQCTNDVKYVPNRKVWIPDCMNTANSRGAKVNGKWAR